MGVHGTVSARVLISGPFSDLRAQGDLRLGDVHRWDLLPSPGDDWRVRFRASIDLAAHKLDLVTLPADTAESPATLRLRANDFMTHPTWSVLASMRKAPLASLLPLGRRMGIALPAGLEMDGALDGVVGFSNSAGLEGGVVITNAVAKVPDMPPLRSASANVTISANRIHIDPAILQSDFGGTLRAGGDFDLTTQDMTAEISADQFSAVAFKQTTRAWFGNQPSGSPEALSMIEDGNLSGHFVVASGPKDKPSWYGQVQLTNATVAVPGAAAPVKRLQGRATFDENTFDLPHMSGVVAQLPFTGSYRYNIVAKHPEHLRVEFAAADLSQIESALAPALRDDSLLSHLPFTRRTIPSWLANRSMEGDVSISQFSIHDAPLGPMSAHFVWQGTAVELTKIQMGMMTTGSMHGSGNVALSARLPRYHFAMQVIDYPWGGGILAADGSFDSSGTGMMALQNLAATGTFFRRRHRISWFRCVQFGLRKIQFYVRWRYTIVEAQQIGSAPE